MKNHIDMLIFQSAICDVCGMENFMFQNKQWVFNLIALLILLTGMCVDEVRVDSVFAYPQSVSVIDADMSEKMTADVETEAVTFLCVRNSVAGSQIAAQIITGSKTIKLSVVFLCVAVFSLLLSNFYAVEHIAKFPRLSVRTAVLTYIHNTDGKK